jgi:(1->4)-alpha-D-glucan 1-alpha-D-glucosylmutase
MTDPDTQAGIRIAGPGPVLPVPTATYRLQFHAAFTFDDATAIVAYLDALGISHCYASSYLAAVPGSTHGYDVADPTRLNPEIGTDETYRRWVSALRAHGMGHIIDLVPNHMGIAKSANPWWQEVLENGPSSLYARVFDIDWHPLKVELENKVLLPILGDSYGVVLERQEVVLRYQAGVFSLHYFETTLPVAPGSYARILETDVDALVEALGAESSEAAEYLSILTAIRRLPSRADLRPASRIERAREKEVIKRRLATLTRDCAAVRAHVERAVELFNGTKGDKRSFDRLDELLSGQAYRLAHWRVAAEEINYRRFFDINELAAIRTEDPEVFRHVHALVFELLKYELVDGFRIDHVDGLYDPGDYLARLQDRAHEARPDLFGPGRPLFVVVEKILALDEELPDWRTHGTSGYDFLIQLNGLFVDGRNEKAFNAVWENFTRLKTAFREIAYRSKQLVLRLSMASELNVLAHQLNRFSERSRYYRDFTLNSLTQAMREIIACFPVYRTYVNEREQVRRRDRQYIEFAVAEAKRRNPGRPRAVFDFVRDLLLKQADYIPEEEREEHLRFVGKFQQVTSPVTAKGIEDTALYNYNRLVSLNEVGGEPDHFGIAPDALHDWLRSRAAKWPHALSATSTHDTKRSEDVRARLNALSELPGAWKQAAGRWARANRRGRTTIDDQSYPSRNEEYLLYQTLVGSWPLDPMDAEGERIYRERIVSYMQKAMREAKIVTSWLNPSERHEQAMKEFIEAILDVGNTAFRDDFIEFQARIARYGIYNSLAQVAVKVGAPGVPDFYQGTELWDFSLVDPDNRRPVDYARRAALLEELTPAVRREGGLRPLFERLAASPTQDRLKLAVTHGLLDFRRAHADIFQHGDYEPLAFEGVRREHAFGFARRHGGHRVLVIVPRLIAGLIPDANVPPLGEKVWGDTIVRLPERAASIREVAEAADSDGGGSPDSRASFRNALTGERTTADAHALRLADIFAVAPVAMLHSSS